MRELLEQTAGPVHLNHVLIDNILLVMENVIHVVNILFLMPVIKIETNVLNPHVVLIKLLHQKVVVKHVELDLIQINLKEIVLE